MRGRPWHRHLLLLLLASLLLGCKAAPTTVLLHVQTSAGVGDLEELLLTVLPDAGPPIRDRRLPPEGRPALPGDVVLYPPGEAGMLRILVRGRRGGATVAEGATTVRPVRATQVEAEVVLTAGPLPDRDGDGVPDAVDNCPDVPNPDQGPCAADARVEGRTDARDGPAPDLKADAGLDLRSDLHADLSCDKDKDGHLSVACGGDDCDDDHAAAHPGGSEGPPGSPTCSDGLDNDCDGSTDLKDTQCKNCSADADCNDGNPCTSDTCPTGLCSNAPTSEGLPCDDKNACTTQTTCKAGVCTGGQAVVCPTPANPCQQASCGPTSGCVTSNRPNGTGCSDGLFCTEPDACQAGACVGPPRNCSAGVLPCHARTCNEATDTCDDTAVANGTTCDDSNSCTQGERCQAGSCTPPALLTEVIQKGNNIINVGTPSTAVDSAGFVHTAFYDDTAKQVRYATNKSGAWVTEVVAATADGDAWPSLVLDPQQLPHVAYVDTANALRHTVRSSTAWLAPATVASPAAGPTSMAVGTSGSVHLTFTRGTSQELHYAVGSATWQTTQLGTTTASGNELASSIALDAQGHAHVACGWMPAYRLRYSTNASGAWVSSEPAASALPGISHGLWPSLRIGPSGTLYISHQQLDSAKAVLYLTTFNGAWQTITAETVTGGTGTVSGRFTSLVLDSNEKAHIAYRNAVQQVLRHVTNQGGSWVGQDMDTGGDTGRWVSIARASSGTIHLTYERQPALELRHVVFSACP